MLRRSKPSGRRSRASRAPSGGSHPRPSFSGADRRRRSQTRSGAGTAHTSGTPCSQAACTAACWRCPCHQKRHCPISVLQSRQSHAGSSSCRSPKAQEGDKLLVVDVQRKSVQDLLPIELDNNVFQRYDQIFIHFYCIPLCGISRYSTLFTHRFFLGSAQSPWRVSANYAAPQRFVTRLPAEEAAASSTYNANVSGQKRFTL